MKLGTKSLALFESKEESSEIILLGIDATFIKLGFPYYLLAFPMGFCINYISFECAHFYIFLIGA